MPKIKSSTDLRNHYLELCQMLGEGRRAINEGRKRPAEDVFNDIFKRISERGNG
ncbi:MAG: hypothetical protein FWC16_07330 [Defluviitaleaceae bacterium]|nr:hypothetical protein [Defluviitaleaceae bacterium]MCL2274725.1 hypothetical protein [Defluviitaleaceae bacterium]